MESESLSFSHLLLEIGSHCVVQAGLKKILKGNDPTGLVSWVAEATEVHSHAQGQGCVYLSFYLKCLEYLHIADQENNEPRMKWALTLTYATIGVEAIQMNKTMPLKIFSLIILKQANQVKYSHSIQYNLM